MGRSVEDRVARRLWVPKLTAGPNLLANETAHHALVVLRLAIGDKVSLFDGRGHEAQARIEAIDRRHKTLTALADEPQNRARPNLALTVALAPPKGTRADWAVEKLTELGVARIVWLGCERNVVRLRSGRLERWRRLAIAAAQQCGRADLPVIEEGPSWPELLAQKAPPHAYIAQRGGAALQAVSVSAPTHGILLVGPEGGFTCGELERAQQEGYTMISLGFFTLRVETAAVAGAAVLLGAKTSGAC